jgi:hypothetical protein
MTTLLKKIRVGSHGLERRTVVKAVALSFGVLILGGFLLLLPHFVNGEHLLRTPLTAAGAKLKTNDEDFKVFDRAMLRMSTLSDVEEVTPLKSMPCGRGATTGFMVEGPAPKAPDKGPVVN